MDWIGDFYGRHHRKIAAGLWAIALGIGIYTTNLSHHTDKREAVDFEAKILTANRKNCDAEISDLTHKIELESFYAQKYVSPEKLSDFTTERLLPLVTTFNKANNDCIPVYYEYAIRMPELIKQAELEQKLAYNPFLALSSPE